MHTLQNSGISLAIPKDNNHLLQYIEDLSLQM